MDTVFPWQQDIWQSFVLRRQQQRMPHALLLLGMQGVGKLQFARALAAAMLCAAPEKNGNHCGRCKSCLLVAAQSHPDFLQITPDEKGQVIKIDQIRALVDFVNTTALLGGYRVIIIHPAAAMNISAANALLKTLEEPTPRTLLILIDHQHGRIPATIKSRCQRIHFNRPETGLALQWLQTSCQNNSANLEFILNLAQGAPLKAQAFLENDILTLRHDLFENLLLLSQHRGDPLQTAVSWLEKDKIVMLDWLLLLLNDVLRCKMTAGQSALVNTDRASDVTNLAQRIALEKLLRYLERVQQIVTRTIGSLNLNQQLLLEEIFIEWKLCF